MKSFWGQEGRFEGCRGRLDFFKGKMTQFLYNLRLLGVKSENLVIFVVIKIVELSQDVF